jgi:hypothetical protein
LITVAVAAGFFVTTALPAQAESDLVQSKGFSSGGAKGSVKRYADRSGGKVKNWVTVSAEDDPGGKCTETWWDYATKPHQHFNPGVVVNCSGSDRTLSPLHVTSYHGIAGMQVIVCEVPDTNGRITRNSSNCRGNLGGMYLHSGKRYDQFSVKAIQYPNGITVHRM